MTSKGLSDYERGILISGMSPGSAGMMLGRSTAWIERQRARLQALAVQGEAEVEVSPAVAPEAEAEPEPEPEIQPEPEVAPAKPVAVGVEVSDPPRPMRQVKLASRNRPAPKIDPRPARARAPVDRTGEFGLYRPGERGDASPPIRLDRDDELVRACLSAGGFPRVFVLPGGKVVWAGPDGGNWRMSQPLAGVARRKGKVAGHVRAGA